MRPLRPVYALFAFRRARKEVLLWQKSTAATSTGRYYAMITRVIAFTAWQLSYIVYVPVFSLFFAVAWRFSSSSRFAGLDFVVASDATHVAPIVFQALSKFLYFNTHSDHPDPAIPVPLVTFVIFGSTVVSTHCSSMPFSVDRYLKDCMNAWRLWILMIPVVRRSPGSPCTRNRDKPTTNIDTSVGMEADLKREAQSPSTVIDISWEKSIILGTTLD